MFLIPCPHCGELRSEEEFHRAGEAHLMRPADPDACSDAEWGDYLFFRNNPRGEYREMWVHASGCRKHFNLVRNTATYEILGSYRIGETFESGTDSAASSSAAGSATGSSSSGSTASHRGQTGAAEGGAQR